MEMKTTPGQDSICTVSGAKVRWIEVNFPRLSGWAVCPLHAAAPELLETCKAALYGINTIRGDADSDAEVLAERIQTAIDKVEGRTP